MYETSFELIYDIRVNDKPFKKLLDQTKALSFAT